MKGLNLLIKRLEEQYKNNKHILNEYFRIDCTQNKKINFEDYNETRIRLKNIEKELIFYKALKKCLDKAENTQDNINYQEEVKSR